MFSARLSMLTALLVALLCLLGCDGITDDLLPSGDDKQLDVVDGSMGTHVGQQSDDFSVLDTLGNSRGLYDELTNPTVDGLTATGVVLYFTMWCPICDSHMSHMRSHIMPNFPAVKFFLVDYVTGSVSISRSSQLSNGYSSIETLVDMDTELEVLYRGAMGTTVVIDNTGIVRMNELYKDGFKLTETLQALP